MQTRSQSPLCTNNFAPNHSSIERSGLSLNRTTQRDQKRSFHECRRPQQQLEVVSRVSSPQQTEDLVKRLSTPIVKSFREKTIEDPRSEEKRRKQERYREMHRKSQDRYKERVTFSKIQSETESYCQQNNILSIHTPLLVTQLHNLLAHLQMVPLNGASAADHSARFIDELIR